MHNEARDPRSVADATYGATTIRKRAIRQNKARELFVADAGVLFHHVKQGAAGRRVVIHSGHLLSLGLLKPNLPAQPALPARPKRSARPKHSDHPKHFCTLYRLGALPTPPQQRQTRPESLRPAAESPVFSYERGHIPSPTQNRPQMDTMPQQQPQKGPPPNSHERSTEPPPHSTRRSPQPRSPPRRRSSPE